MYSSMAACSGMDRGYTLPFVSLAPGSGSTAQSHALCGGSLVAASLVNTSWNAQYSWGMVNFFSGSGLSTLVEQFWRSELVGGVTRSRQCC